MTQRRKWITGGLIGAGVILIILGLTIGSGDDGNSSSTNAAATGATGPAAAKQGAQPESGTTSHTPSTDGKQSGGSTASSSDKTANGGGASTQPSGETSKPKQKSKPQSTPKATPPASLKDVRIEDLSPADRRKLQKDLYRQGENTCFAYGPELLAKEYKFTATDPQEVARQFANLNEQGNKSLALPYQQGCIAGFKRWAKEHK